MGLPHFTPIIIIIIIIDAAIIVIVKWLHRALTSVICCPRRDFFVLQSIQTGCGAHPASYPMSEGSSFQGATMAKV
jgi:hypothetical protein